MGLLRGVKRIVSSSPSPTNFVCEVDERYRAACERLDFYSEHEDKQYCVLHYPGVEKNEEDFLKVKHSKLDRKDYDFGGTVFPRRAADFIGCEFDGANFADAVFFGEANFQEGVFNGVTRFQNAQFKGYTSFDLAQFRGELTSVFFQSKFRGYTSFTDAQFFGTQLGFGQAEFSGENTWFLGAIFGSRTTDFQGALFNSKYTHFSHAQFRGEETYFGQAQFDGASVSFENTVFSNRVVLFDEARFGGRVDFSGIGNNRVFNEVSGYMSGVWFRDCRIEEPRLITFNHVFLHPSWFFNFDVRNVDFTDVEWYGIPNGPKGSIEDEIDAIAKRGRDFPHVLLSQVCQRLAANSEDSRDYPLANEFYYWSMEALRKEGWRRLGLIRTVYGALSGYGVRPLHAGLVLLAIYALFTVIYMLVPSSPFSLLSASEGCQAIVCVGKAAAYSLGALARLSPDKPSISPGWFQFWVTAEGILGPLQIALLALAIRRKVMR